jgi:hypothetical protein
MDNASYHFYLQISFITIHIILLNENDTFLTENTKK